MRILEILIANIVLPLFIVFAGIFVSLGVTNSISQWWNHNEKTDDEKGDAGK